MISTRTRGTSLLNYLRQKGIPCEVKYNFCRESGSGMYLQWVGTLEVYGKTFSGFGKTHKSTIDNLMELATPLIYSNIKPKGYAELLC
jgi:hypothetical protein